MIRKKDGKKNIAGTVRDLISPTVETLGYRIWDVEYVKEGADMYLRVTIDSDDGIGIEDCEKVNRAIDPILDEADPIEGSYYLEVSSPGVERVLSSDEHFERMKGAEVEVKLFSPVDGKKSYCGTLIARDGEFITLDSENGEIKLENRMVSKVTTVFHW